MAENGPKWQKWPETAKTARTAGKKNDQKTLRNRGISRTGRRGSKRPKRPKKVRNAPQSLEQPEAARAGHKRPRLPAQPSPVHLASQTRPASTRCHRDRLPAGYSVRSIPPYLRHEAASCKNKPKRQKRSRASTRGGLLPNRPNQAQEEPRFNTQRTLTPQSSPEQSK